MAARALASLLQIKSAVVVDIGTDIGLVDLLGL